MMVPFKVFDRQNKQIWLVLNYHPDSKGGKYLAALENDEDTDGEMQIIDSAQLVKFKFLEFLEEVGE